MFYVFMFLAAGLLFLHGKHLYNVYHGYHELLKVHKPMHIRDVIAVMVAAGESYRNPMSQFETYLDSIYDQEVKEALHLLKDGAFNDPLRLDAYRTAQRTAIERFDMESERVFECGRYLPLVGLAVAIVALSWLFNSIGLPEFRANFFTAATCMFAALFYSLTLSYLVVLPLTNHYREAKNDLIMKFKVINEGVKDIVRRPNPLHFAEKLNSLVPEDVRYPWEDFVKTHLRKPA